MRIKTMLLALGALATLAGAAAPALAHEDRGEPDGWSRDDGRGDWRQDRREDWRDDRATLREAWRADRARREALDDWWARRDRRDWRGGHAYDGYGGGGWRRPALYVTYFRHGDHWHPTHVNGRPWRRDYCGRPGYAAFTFYGRPPVPFWYGGY